MDKAVGILGGGQLGRYLAEAANHLNIKTLVLDKAGAPAKQVVAHNQHVDGTFKSANDVRALAARCDVLTVEIEHVDTHVLEQLAADAASPSIQPSWRTIRLIQNKYHQKQRLREQGVRVADFAEVQEPTDSAVHAAVSSVGGFPVMLKACTDAYDGRGNFPLREASDVSNGLSALKERPLYVEAWADFRMELAVMVVKTNAEAAASDDTDTWRDSTLPYSAVETVHENSICKLTYCPPRSVSVAIQSAAQTLARRAVAAFEGTGIFGVEMFLLKDDILLINEIAPRVHNSGHYTLAATLMSQFEAHLRAILHLPIHPEDLEPLRPSIMLNILGGSTPKAHLKLAEAATNARGCKVFLYGKGEGTPGRKMGHIVITGRSMSEAEALAEPLVRLANEIQGVDTNASLSLTPVPRPAPVLVLMGSDSDLPVLAEGLRLLDTFGVGYRVTVTSAHRTPHRMAEVSESAQPAGHSVIIAAAGGAAHLPGMSAAHTRLPVIGVPVKPTIGEGMDSLLSIVQMPRGCPVAAVAINNSFNAALLAVCILAISDPALDRKLMDYLQRQSSEVIKKAERMEEIGWRTYLETMPKK